MSGCSKAPWGLSVQSRVTCIFTGISISPGPSLRQCPSRYTFRAGRNLPDKEFRYLRTVIVTAAVYWGFNSKLLLAMTSPLNLPAPGRCQHLYTSDFSLAGTCVCGKIVAWASLLPPAQAPTERSSPAPCIHFSRSYGCILPSSLTRFSHTPHLKFSPAYLCRFWYGYMMSR